MNCQDVAKLRTPLDAVCQTTDIGCVPIVNGKPTCKPQPDELPIAYDKTTSTLWLFSCDTREWVAHKKFTMDELQDLNLENLNNICSILRIGVFYNPGTGTIQGNVSLGEFAEQLLKCLDLETKVVTVTQGENNTIKISIEGLDGLPPTYIKGDNVWFTGTGTEGDPVVVHTYDPICKWPVASQSAVDAATTKHLGACLDGQPSRVPYPPKPCEYPSLSKAQVDAAGEKRLIACVDGESVKVPWLETPCEYEQKSEEQVANATEKNLIACVDGEAVKVPYPKFQPPVCEANQLTLEQASAAGSSLTLLGCEDNSVVRIPVSGSGFFDRDYICVPTVTAAPTDAPLSGTGPLRIGCNGELYVWICNSEGTGRWEEVRYNMNSLSKINLDNVSDICTNLRLMGWYSDATGDVCVQQVKLTISDIIEAFRKCDENVPDGFYRYIGNDQGHILGCVNISVNAGNIVYQSRNATLLEGSFNGTPSTNPPRPSYALLTVRNPFNVTSLVELHAHCAFGCSTPSFVPEGEAIFILTDVLNVEYKPFVGYYERHSVYSWKNMSRYNTVAYSQNASESINFYDTLPAYGTKTYYAQYWVACNVSSPTTIEIHPYINCYAVVHRNFTTDSNYTE